MATIPKVNQRRNSCFLTIFVERLVCRLFADHLGKTTEADWQRDPTRLGTGSFRIRGQASWLFELFGDLQCNGASFFHGIGTE